MGLSVRPSNPFHELDQMLLRLFDSSCDVIARLPSDYQTITDDESGLEFASFRTALERDERLKANDKLLEAQRDWKAKFVEIRQAIRRIGAQFGFVDKDVEESLAETLETLDLLATFQILVGENTDAAEKRWYSLTDRYVQNGLKLQEFASRLDGKLDAAYPKIPDPDQAEKDKHKNVKTTIESKNLAKSANSRTPRGESQILLSSALTNHHGYSNGHCKSFEPIGNNALADKAKVGKATASQFFKVHFGGIQSYRAMCHDRIKLVFALKMLNGEVTPAILTKALPKDDLNEDRED